MESTWVAQLRVVVGNAHLGEGGRTKDDRPRHRACIATWDRWAALVGGTRMKRQRCHLSGEDDTTELSLFSLKPATAGAESAGLQPGEFVAAAGVTKANRELVAHEFTATTGEDGRTAGEACSLLLAIAGGRTSDAAAVRGDAEPDRAATDTDAIGGSWSSQQRNPSINWLG
jgi:hypothetical protein